MDSKEKSETGKIIGAGITGAVIGAASAAAAAYLSKKENREKVKRTFHEISSKGRNKLDEMQHGANELKEKSAEAAEEKIDQAEGVASEISKKSRSKAKELKEEIEEEEENL